MYVNPFWFGVMTTIAFELGTLFIFALWYGGKR